MKTIMNGSENFIDPRITAEDILSRLPKMQKQNSLGLLVCDSEIDYETVAEIISQNVEFPVIGVTTYKVPQSREKELSATFTVIEKDELNVSIAVSTSLFDDNSTLVEDTFDECVNNLESPAKMFIPLVAMIPGLTADRYMKKIFKLAGKIPVFGGMSTSNLLNTEAAVMVDGKTYKDSLILVALGGDIDPIFSVGSSLTPMAAHSPTVTKSSEDTVMCVDDMTFCEYMSCLGIAPEDRQNGVDALMQYGPIPCRLTHKLEDDDGVAELRCISYTNVGEGSATFSSDMPVGTRISMGLIQFKDVEESYKKCIGQIKEEVAAAEHPEKYTTLLAIPCVARYFALHGNNLEYIMDEESLPDGLALSGFYGFLEVGPTMNNQGEIHNRSHNASIVMCAF